MPLLHGLLNGIVMSGDKVHRNTVLAAIFQKGPDPLLIGAATDGRASHPKASIHRLHGIKAAVEQLKVLLHVRILPESPQIGLIPDLHGPLHHLGLPIALHQMAQQCLYHPAPRVIVLGRCGISLPVKYRLRPSGHFSRHESQFQKRAQPQLQIAVHDPVKVGEIIFLLFHPALLILLIDGHIVTEQSMAPDVPESDFLLNQLQLLLIFLGQRQTHPARPDAKIHMIIELRPCPFLNYNTLLLHIQSSLLSPCCLLHTGLFHNSPSALAQFLSSSSAIPPLQPPTSPRIIKAAILLPHPHTSSPKPQKPLPNGSAF